MEDMCYESRRAVEGLYVQEGDLLEVPAKRLRSPRPTSPNGPLLSAPPPHPTSQSPPRPGIADIPVCTSRNYQFVFDTFSDSGFMSTLQTTVNVITFGSGKQLFPGLTATGINSVRGALPVEIIDSLHFKL